MIGQDPLRAGHDPGQVPHQVDGGLPHRHAPAERAARGVERVTYHRNNNHVLLMSRRGPAGPCPRQRGCGPRGVRGAAAQPRDTQTGGEVPAGSQGVHTAG